jgi:hypothetical protein
MRREPNGQLGGAGFVESGYDARRARVRNRLHERRRGTWQLNGVANPNRVKTNGTTVLSSTELVANITIADTADVTSWDVQVALVGGKKGIGTGCSS